MKLSELFIQEPMDLNLPAGSKSQTIRHLAERFEACGGVTDINEFIKALEAREAQSTTGVGDEIAIPHAQHTSIQEPAIIFGRSETGIEWESMDGQPAKLIFMIAAPEGAGGAHLEALAKLSSVLMKVEAKEALLNATSTQEVVEVFQSYEEESIAETSTMSEPAQEDRPYIVAVTACPTGIAHTFMAEEKLKQTASDMGIDIKVETNGQVGVNNRLTHDDIERAAGVIVAADKQVPMARFAGKPTLIRPVADGINKASELVELAATGKAPIYHSDMAGVDEEEESGNGSLGSQFYRHLMNGVSHMLPFVVAGGILIALSFMWGINSSDVTDPSYNPIAEVLMSLGNMAFAMMLPILAGFIGQSIADRPGLVIGFMGGIFANPEILSSFNSEAGVFADAVPSGFLGALVAGFLGGGIVWLLNKLFAWLPKSLDGMKPIFIYPVLGTLLIGLIMLFVVNAPMGAVMNGLVNFINNIPSEFKILIGFAVGAMMSIDMGGPINKAAYVTGTALVTASGGAGSDVMASVMVGGMVPPLAIALAATIRPRLWPEAQRNSALVNYVMGAAFITEGAIPFAASNPVRVIPPLAIGAGVSGALSMLFGSVSLVPHGGVFAVLAGGITNPLLFMVAWLIGGLVGAIGLMYTMRHENQE